METEKLNQVISPFLIEGTVSKISPLGNGLINDTYKIETKEDNFPDYVLQRVNNEVFTDVDLLQHNIEVVTNHIREKLQKQGESELDRKVLRFIPTKEGKTYFKDSDGKYWRISVFIPDAKTYELVDAAHSLSLPYIQSQTLHGRTISHNSMPSAPSYHCRMGDGV